MPAFNPVSRIVFPAALLMALALPVLAQEAAPAEGAEAPPETPAEGAPETGFSTGQEVDGIGSTYTAETHGDWQLNCIRTEDGSDPCQLYQLLKDVNGNPVAEINLTTLPAGGPAAAGATIITPLETLLTEGLKMSVDGGKAKIYPFTFCAAIGCISRVGLTADEVEALKKGANATIAIVPMAAPEQKVEAKISLTGFTAGYDAVAAVVAAGKPPAPAEE
jgi:invasion protein IalB